MPDTTFLDWPFFEARHRALAEQLDEFARTKLAELAHGASDDAALDRACREIVHRLGAEGFLNQCCVTEPGGKFDVRSLALSRETLARHGGLADFCFAMQGLGTGPISLFGTEAQKRKYLPPVMRGKRIAAFALSEPQAGSDVSAIATEAARSGSEYVLNGTKTWISNGGLADHYVVFARTGEGPGSKGLSAFVVDADVEGLKVVERISLSAAAPAGDARLQGLPRASRRAARRSGRRVQDRDGDARRVPDHGRRGRARVCAPRTRRGARALPRAGRVRQAARRIPADPGKDRRDGARGRCGGTAGLPRRLDEGRARQARDP
jgi:acyl-CoA dehydrogenase